VFNKDSGQFTVNTPFLHKWRIEEGDQLTRSGRRKASRLMKSLMYGSEGRVGISSYNIVGVAYKIPDQDLLTPRPRELMVLEACYEFCERLRGDALLRTSIKVPDGHRGVFGEQPGATLEKLDALAGELGTLRRDIVTVNVRSFTKLAEARVDYAVPAINC
jgi:hypothetical protein